MSKFRVFVPGGVKDSPKKLPMSKFRIFVCGGVKDSPMGFIFDTLQSFVTSPSSIGNITNFSSEDIELVHSGSKYGINRIVSFWA
jgi:hypothetical protein